MTRYFCACVLTLVLLAGSLARADKIKLSQGTTKTGKVTDMSSSEVTVEQGGEKKIIPVNEIESILYDGEPNDLVLARNQMNKGAYDEALKFLDKIDLADIKRSEIKQDIEFYRALAAARAVLAGSRDKKDLEAAGRQLQGVVKNANNYHFFEANEALGDVLVAWGLADKADDYYRRLASAPWPDYRMRAGVLIGRALTTRKDYDKAVKQFDEVIATAGEGKEIERQRLAARLGKATALSAADKNEEAIKLLDEVIDKADPENRELHARAYTARGNCYKQSGNKQHAVLDFLHVDLLYPMFPEQHAEALANLATLWKDVDKPKRAEEARSQLLERYPNSVWAKGAEK